MSMTDFSRRWIPLRIGSRSKACWPPDTPLGKFGNPLRPHRRPIAPTAPSREERAVLIQKNAMHKLGFGGAKNGIRNILCLGAHCDDIEIGCGGTLLRLKQENPQ